MTEERGKAGAPMTPREVIAKACYAEWEDWDWADADEPGRLSYLHDADSILSALEQAGMVVVPVEPSEKVLAPLGKDLWARLLPVVRAAAKEG